MCNNNSCEIKLTYFTKNVGPCYVSRYNEVYYVRPMIQVSSIVSFLKIESTSE